MEFRLLGPVEITVDGRVIDSGPLQHRAVLAALAAEAGRPVSVESLIDRVWEVPPARPRRALQVYISRIRRVLATADGSGRTPVDVVRRAGSYLLDIDPDQVDVHRFRRLVGQARNGDDRQRLARLERALELWRGPPLSDLPGRWAVQVRQGWQQQYLDAVVAWALACLQMGDPGAALPRLSELVAEHPQVESLAAAYLRALYAAGRPADALDHYATVRQRLADELGTDPSPELRQLHRQILVADPVLEPPPAQPPVPRQLPAPPQMFTGRATELADLDKGVDASTVVVTAIDGMAGIGKTALAVQAAHRIADHYPDGQLFIDLHGYTQGIAPLEPAEALDHALRALGIPGTQIPGSLDQRAALYRSRLADQQILIVLDNAATEAQVEPLLPGAPGCLVLVTSRRRLAGLEHTHTLSLDSLPTSDAVALFLRTAGIDRLAGQAPELLAELVELCGRLPLAIRIAAARLRSHPTWTLAHLTERLRDHRHRLSELAAGHRSVTAALDLSYEHLSPDQQHTYRLIGLHPGPDIDAYATAALLDSTVVQARQLLDQLLDANLLIEPEAGRYRFHDLTRAHAAHTATTSQADPTGAALDRLLDHYRHAASIAMDTAHPYERERRPLVPPAGTPRPELSGAAAAGEWLDTELANLLAAARFASTHDRPAHTLHLSAILHRHLRTRGRYHDAESLHRQALATARAARQQPGELSALAGLGHIHRLRAQYEQAMEHLDQALHIARVTGDRPGELDALNGLGHTHRLQGRPEPATDHYQQALHIAHTTGDRPGELDALNGLGHIHRLQGRYEQAADRYQQALHIARATGDHPGELTALSGLGQISLLQGRYEQATDHYQGALHTARTTGDHRGELYALVGLGQIHQLLGRSEHAADHYQRALRIARTIGHRHGERNALTGLADMHRLQGRYEPASGHFRELVELARMDGDRNAEFEARQGLGRLHHAIGDPEAALIHHQRALALAAELSQPDDQARAHDGLAYAHHALHRYERARHHWQHALDLLTGLGVDHAEDEETTVAAIRANLARVD